MATGRLTLGFVLLAFAALSNAAAADKQVLLNVSYDPTRELYQEYNARFVDHWKAKTGKVVEVQQSHGGSGKQARAVIDGLEDDVVTLALAYDIDAIVAQSGLLPVDWQRRLPDNSAPYTSTIVFLVRAGNPKGIKDWDDLVKDGIEVITPDPKSSGGARWNYLAAWGWALKRFNGDEAKVREYMRSLFARVPVLDAGARGSTTTFAQRGLGDVLLAWENEAFLALKEFGKDKFEVVARTMSILAEACVALVDKVADKHGTRAAAEEYLRFLYSETGQDLAGKHFYRPRREESRKKYENVFPRIELFTIDDVFGGWKAAQDKHFREDGIFDQIYPPR